MAFLHRGRVYGAAPVDSAPQTVFNNSIIDSVPVAFRVVLGSASRFQASTGNVFRVFFLNWESKLAARLILGWRKQHKKS
jgi:hypothetical protein